jgi:hypothetical protein
MIKLLKCLIYGHAYDWFEYDIRIRKEQHYASNFLVYCKRCNRYKNYKKREDHVL